MSQNRLVDLTGSSDEDRALVSRSASSRKPQIFQNSITPASRAATMVDLTATDDTDPYLLSGTLNSPWPRSLPKVPLYNDSVPPASHFGNGRLHLNGVPPPLPSTTNGVIMKTAGSPPIPPEHLSRWMPPLAKTPRLDGDRFRIDYAVPIQPAVLVQPPVSVQRPMSIQHVISTVHAPMENLPIYPPILFPAAQRTKEKTPTRNPVETLATTNAREKTPNSTSSNVLSMQRVKEKSPVSSPVHTSDAQRAREKTPISAEALTPIAQIPTEKTPLPNVGEVVAVQKVISSPGPNDMTDTLYDYQEWHEEPTPSTDFPLSLEAFQKALQKSLRNLRSDHQYYIKSRLPHARYNHSNCTARRNSSDTGTHEAVSKAELLASNGHLQTSSPFADLKPLKVDQDVAKRDTQHIGKLCQLGPRVTKQGPDITSVPIHRYNAGNITIPPYTNYISTKRNILIEDDKNRTFLPYYGDDAYIDRDYAELESRITRNRINYHRTNALSEKAELYSPYAGAFLNEVGCNVSLVLHYLLDESRPPVPIELPQEFVDMWRNRETHLGEGYYDDGEELNLAKPRLHSKKRRPLKKWRAVFDSLPSPSSGRQLAVAGLACAAFANIMGFSLWHIVKRHRLVLDAVNRKYRSIDHANGMAGIPGSTSSPTNDSNLLGTYVDLGCLVCYAHECPGHGEFDDEEEEKNIRIRINAKPASPTSPRRKVNGTHFNGDHVHPLQATIEGLLGMNDDKTITGKPWAALREENCGFGDDELCSDSCFWLKKNRSATNPAWCEEDKKLFNALVQAHLDNRRGSCFLALGMEKPCHEIFQEIVRLVEMTSITSARSRRGAVGQVTRPAPRRHFDHWLEHSKTWEHHDRPPFKPCNHLGPCSASTGCHCYEQNVTCEKTCMCADNCSRRYRGCTCAARNKACWQNEKCDCYRLNRECDPDLCLSCGAHEVLDPANRYRTDIADGKCTNVFVQRGVPRRTLLGHSKLLASGGVDGWGLYMGEATKKGDYIGEYVGEVISKEESEQRGIIYNKRNLSYLFDLNSTQTLDSTLVGNKFRYINHQAPPYANCQAKTLFCNTVHRIGMFACRNIEVGEEILFDYGEGFAAKFDLIRLDDQAQPKIEKRKKAIVYSKIPLKGPTLSKNGKRIGRPRKHPLPLPTEEELKDNAIMLAVSPAANKNVAPMATKRTLKRKRSPEVFGLDGAAEEDDEFEDVLVSDDVAEEISSSDSFHESDDDDGENKRRRKAKKAKRSNVQKRGWRTKVVKRIGKRVERGRSRGPRDLMRQESRPMGGKQTAMKRGSRPGFTSMDTGHLDEGLGNEDSQAVPQDIFDFETPQKRAWRTRHGIVGKGKEVERGDQMVIDETPQQAATPQKRGWQTRYANMGWTHKVHSVHGTGEGSSTSQWFTAEPPEPHTSEKRGFKSARSLKSHKRHMLGGGLRHQGTH